MQETNNQEILHDESNTSRVKKINEILPVLSIILLVIGFLRHYFYHQSFGINISERIKIIEMLSLFSQP